MRLAHRALIAALVSLVLCAAVSAQTLRSPNDPRNQSPAVGTGGPEGGPTGLFTIYDGSTLRRGEFTFSIAYSNFDRDPGNVDIVDVPLSFNVGLNDHIEVFFKTTGWRGIKVNNPQNLSSFYLPNSQLFCGAALCRGAAIVLSPSGPNVGTLAGTAVFRPLNNQPFVQFPFVGGSAGTFGLAPGPLGGIFGFPGFNAQLGPPVVQPNSGNFGPADNFPGIGSPVGGILPGVVLATTTLPATALNLPITVPLVFTVAPTYLPDAPFVNRLFGESSFNNMVFGGKIRFTGPNNPLGVGLIPFYRWWMDKGNDFSGFNQMQRGAGPGGDIGDFGLIGFVDGRLGKHVNVSANGGYILNSNPKGLDGDFVLLDRPDELLTGIGLDFPVNEHFQPIVEVRSTTYVGGHTPNAFNNNPVDVIGGVKIYPRRWFGIGLAYRRHLNQQDMDHFDPVDATLAIGQVTNVNVPGRGLVVVPGTTRPVTSQGFPVGFIFSEEPNGFIGQFWIGRRNARTPPIPPNTAPTVSSVTPSMASVLRPCPEGQSSATCTPSGSEVTLVANASDPDNDQLLYTWSVTGGRLSGEGRQVTWDLSGVANGSYTATVEVNDGNTHTATGNTTVTVADCTGCVAPPPPCPVVSVSCPTDVEANQPITFTASVSGGAAGAAWTYNWSVSAGTISSGQGTPTITVDTANLSGQSVTATVSIGGADPSCTGTTASCTASIKTPPAAPTKFDEYGNIRFNDEKARLDNYAIQLQNQPGATGTIIVYGSCAGEAQQRGDRAKDYLVNTRGIEAGRITVVDGGCRSDLTVQLWVVPAGATAPTVETTGAIEPCPECRRGRAPRRRRGDEE
ncbi:MAG TPA: Ig-like domain-containing protein [Pyrinomonadaceae bacterium]|nr:Ig-like domain-containing protein [Pyrinomonadaceae bacterium]